MGKHIGIVGAGVAGLHLGLLLRKHGVDATIITDREPDAVAKMPLVNTVAHHHITLDREAALDIHHWDGTDVKYFCHHHYFNFPQPIVFQGDFASPSRAVDYRIYLPTLMKDFVARGGKIEIRQIGAGDIAGLAAQFDLLVVSTGKGVLGQMFSPCAGKIALRQAAAETVRGSLCRRARYEPARRDAVGFAGPWRADRNPDADLQRHGHGSVDGERARWRSRGPDEATL